jgi:DNA-binding MarR family transcriptional regulator
MKRKLTDPYLKAWRGFITANALLVAAIDKQMIAAGHLPLHWYDVLIELEEAPDHRLRMHELAEKVVLSRSGLTRLVDRLEEAALLHRQPDPDDRRGYYVVISDKGRAALKAAWSSYAQGILTTFADHLSDAEAETLAAAFERMIAAARS